MDTKAERKVDRRVIKTKKAIRNAFVELLSKKDIDHITVKDISDTADINRKTFYNYYSGVYQIVDELENEIVTAFDELVVEIDLRHDIENPYLIFEKLTSILNRDIDFYSHVMKIDSKSTLTPKIINNLKEKMWGSFYTQIAIDEETFNIIIEYVFSGMLAVYRCWFNSDRNISLEQLAKPVSILTSYGINGILKDNNS